MIYVVFLYKTIQKSFTLPSIQKIFKKGYVENGTTYYWRVKSSEVKEKLQLLIDDLIASLNVNELDANQRIKMLQIALQYTLPRIKQATNEVSEDLPLLIW